MLNPSLLKNLLSLCSSKLSSYLYRNLLRTNPSFTVIVADLQNISSKTALSFLKLKLAFKTVLHRWA